MQIAQQLADEWETAISEIETMTASPEHFVAAVARLAQETVRSIGILAMAVDALRTEEGLGEALP